MSMKFLSSPTFLIKLICVGTASKSNLFPPSCVVVSRLVTPVRKTSFRNFVFDQIRVPPPPVVDHDIRNFQYLIPEANNHETQEPINQETNKLFQVREFPAPLNIPKCLGLPLDEGWLDPPFARALCPLSSLNVGDFIWNCQMLISTFFRHS